MTNKKRLIYLPLGGANEVGMNMYLYGYGFPGSEKFILIDIGVTFPDMISSPGVDLIMPDIAFIEGRKEDLLGIFITHAHEDHIGALGYLISKLNAPIYCREFSAQIALSKLEKVGFTEADLRIVETYPETIETGPFKISFLPISHSIPESSCLVIDNPVGRIIHTGDFKIDKTPVVGDPFDENLLLELSKKQVLALVCDSTNVFSIHSGRSEASLETKITELIKAQQGTVVATTFASNVARLLTLAKCATSAGRSILVLGRAMQAMIAKASSVGLLHAFPSTISVEEALSLPRSNLFILATGSQGEGRAASAQLAREKYMNIILENGDCFLFSSKTIPGNEIAVSKIINDLTQRGVNVIDESDGLYHVSGHANRPDLEKIHKIFNPKLIIPMHGELRHLREHEKLAISNGFDSRLVQNGCVLVIDKEGNAKMVEKVHFGRIYYEGGRLLKSFDKIVKTRLHMATRGHLSVCILIENNSILENGIWVKSQGLEQADSELEEDLEASIEMEVQGLQEDEIYNDDTIEAVIKRVCNKVSFNSIGKKPVVTIFINRLN